MTVTASAPVLDHRQKRNTPDWLVYVRSGSFVNVYRFADQTSAAAFTTEINEENNR